MYVYMYVYKHNTHTPVKRQGVSCYINGVPVEVKMSEHSAHGGGVGVEPWHGFPRCRILLLEVLRKHQEIAETSFLEHSK